MMIQSVAKLYRDFEAKAPTTHDVNGQQKKSFTVEQRAAIYQALRATTVQWSGVSYPRLARPLVDILVEGDKAKGLSVQAAYQRHQYRLQTIIWQGENGRFKGMNFVDGKPAKPKAPVTVKSLVQLRDGASSFTPKELVSRGVAMGVTNVEAYLDLQRPIFDGLLQEVKKEGYAEVLKGDILKALQNSPYAAKLDKKQIGKALDKALTELVK